jgi:hypothetical protein
VAVTVAATAPVRMEGAAAEAVATMEPVAEVLDRSRLAG